MSKLFYLIGLIKMKKILWIDDDSKLIDSCIPVFQENDFIIFKATNISKALSILREQKNILDGVLLDVRLNNEDGLEILKDIVDKYPSLKIAIFTGYPEYDDHIIAENIGATAYLDKIEKSIPLDPAKQKSFFDALHKIFTPSNAKNGSTSKYSNITALILTGLFFTFLFVIILLLVSILSNNVSPILFPIVLIGSVLIYSIIGAFILRIQGDEYLTEKSFLKLMLRSLSYLPLINKDKK